MLCMLLPRTLCKPVWFQRTWLNHTCRKSYHNRLAYYKARRLNSAPNLKCEKHCSWRSRHRNSYVKNDVKCWKLKRSYQCGVERRTVHRTGWKQIINELIRNMVFVYIAARENQLQDAVVNNKFVSKYSLLTRWETKFKFSWKIIFWFSSRHVTLTELETMHDDGLQIHITSFHLTTNIDGCE